MIQPVSAFSPRATFRGTNNKVGKKTSMPSNSDLALLNAGGVAAAAGGITTAVARGYTSSWAHAGVLGLFGAFLALFFMTPQLLDKSSTKNAVKKGGVDAASMTKTGQVIKMAEEHLKPAKKLVQFRSDSATPNS